MKKYSLILSTSALIWFMSFSETFAASERLLALIGRVNQHVINPLIVLLFTVGLILFVVGLYNFFGNKENAESLEKGKRHMLWGIVGMAIMVSVFGIMKFLTGSLGITEATGNAEKGGTGDVSGLINPGN